MVAVAAVVAVIKTTIVILLGILLGNLHDESQPRSRRNSPRREIIHANAQKRRRALTFIEHLLFKCQTLC